MSVNVISLFFLKKDDRILKREYILKKRKTMYKKYCLMVSVLVSTIVQSHEWEHAPQETITIAILAKDKAHCLPLYLECIEKQTWPKEKTNLYIRTNNNNDNTAQLLQEWIEKVKDHYLDIYFDASNVADNVEQYKPHEWNTTRFLVLGAIRNDSLEWAYDHNSHYFVADCDNFILPHTLEALIQPRLPIVAPLLVHGSTLYSNYHADIDEHGYFKDSPFYLPLLGRKIKGLVEVPVVHCTYFIRHEYLPYLTYDDNSYRYEYVIFSDSARKNNIAQYLDTRDVYGYLSNMDTATDLVAEPWFIDLCAQIS